MKKIIFIFIAFILLGNIALAELPIKCDKINPKDYDFVSCKEFEAEQYILIIIDGAGVDKNLLVDASYIIGYIIASKYGKYTKKGFIDSVYTLEFGDKCMIEAIGKTYIEAIKISIPTKQRAPVNIRI